MYHRKYCHITCNTNDGEPLASVVTRNKQESDIEHKRNGEGELSGAAAVGGLLYEVEDPNISTVEQNIEVDSVDETPGWLIGGILYAQL